MFAHFGLYAENGGIERDTALCALTNQPVGAGSVTCRIAGTRLFYRLSVTARRRITPAQRGQLETRIRDAAQEAAKDETDMRRAVRKAAKKVVAESKPDVSQGDTDADDA